MGSVVADAHLALEPMLGRTRSAFAEGPEAARTAFDGLRRALETHFEQEDSLYFPTIRALRTDIRDVVAQIGEAHDQYRRMFDEIDTLLGQGGLEAAARAFERFAVSFAEHEQAEEQLLALLQPAWPDPTPTPTPD